MCYFNDLYSPTTSLQASSGYQGQVLRIEMNNKTHRMMALKLGGPQGSSIPEFPPQMQWNDWFSNCLEETP